MKKGTLKAAVVAVVTIAIYSLMAFMIPFDREEVFWISYIFTLVAFVVAGASIYIAFIKNTDATSRFYGFPIARIGVIYSIAQLIVSIVMMALGTWLSWWIPLWIPTLIYAVGLGAALIGLVSVETVVEEICVQDVKLKQNVSLMRNLQTKVCQMASQSDSAALKALAEEFKYSDPVSSEDIAAAEADLVAAVNELQAAFVDGDTSVVNELCKRISALLSERNRLCKLNKK